MPKEKTTALLKVTAVALAAGALWVAVVGVLYLLVDPLTLRDGQMIFSPGALLHATSIMVLLAVLPWIPALLFLRSRPYPVQCFIVSACAWAILGTLFSLFDGKSALFSIGTAASVLANGQDIIFMPVVIPAVSLFSGFSYFLSIILFQRFTRSDAAAQGGAVA